jgi:pimeloyl-ACP methyl ester carboxylesterase
MTIVLVHGAWTGSWSWRDCARVLRRKGYEVYAPTNTGLSERAHVKPQHVTLESHIEDIAGLLRYEDLRDVLLVAHSYGGMPTTGAADRERDRVKGIMYVDAFLPESGQSLWDIVSPEGKATQQKMAHDFDGGLSVPRPPHAPVRPRTKPWPPEWSPQPTGTTAEPYVSVRGAATMDPAQWPPRHYALCTGYENSTFTGLAAKARGAPGWDYSEFDCHHDVVRTQPQMTADRIEEFADKLGIARPYARTP